MASRDEIRFRRWFASAYGDQALLEKMGSFVALLREQATSQALVSKADRDRLWTRHIQECLAPEFVAAFPPSVDVLDVGSGNGLPGIVLALARPDLSVSLVESRRRKAGFLDRTVLLLRCGNVRVENGRLEDIARGGWSWVVSRALTWTAPGIEALKNITTADATLLRFGPARGAPEDLLLPSATHRVVQVWPRATWKDPSLNA